VTVWPSVALAGEAVALATGGWFSTTLVTLTVVVVVSVFGPQITVRRNCSEAPPAVTSGARKVGAAAAGLDSVTARPAGVLPKYCQEYTSCPLVGDEDDPSMVTRVGEPPVVSGTVWLVGSMRAWGLLALHAAIAGCAAAAPRTSNNAPVHPRRLRAAAICLSMNPPVSFLRRASPGPGPQGWDCVTCLTGTP
jgi:hypothetical protein